MSKRTSKIKETIKMDKATEATYKVGNVIIEVNIYSTGEGLAFMTFEGQNEAFAEITFDRFQETRQPNGTFLTAYNGSTETLNIKAEPLA